MSYNAQMSHRKAGNAQVGLSYAFLIGFFLTLGLYGFGIIKVDVMHFLEGGLTMVLSFWFMRQRTTGDEPTPPVSGISDTARLPWGYQPIGDPREPNPPPRNPNGPVEYPKTQGAANHLPPQSPTSNP